MNTSLVKREPPGIKKLKLAAEAGKKGNYRLAVKVLEELITESDSPPEAWLLLGRSLHTLKDYSRALAAFNDYIRQRPKSGDGYLFSGRTYLALGMPYKAVPFLRKAIENSPGDSQTKALLGVAYLKSKHSQAA
ncbi:MAG: tetratricopeptide repeat protein, partial [Treponema sp.]|nr:tetratricopeptide repeat protein [Treponema sp.]